MERGLRFRRLMRWGCGVALLLFLIGLALVPGNTPVAAGSVTVKMVSGHLFQPQDITVTLGTTVTWVNTDTVETHNVLDGDGVFSSPDLPPAYMGQQYSYSYTFTQAGTFNYICTYHAPGMAGTITVIVPPTATPLAEPTRHLGVVHAAPVNQAPATHAPVPTKNPVPALLAQPSRH